MQSACSILVNKTHKSIKTKQRRAKQFDQIFIFTFNTAADRFKMRSFVEKKKKDKSIFSIPGETKKLQKSQQQK